MKRISLTITILLVGGGIGLSAQEPPEKVDSTVIRPRPVPIYSDPIYYGVHLIPFTDLEPRENETREQRAARVNLQTYWRVKTSVEYNIRQFPIRRSQLIIRGPYTFTPGTVPVMNSNNPFIFNVEPSMAPYVRPYTESAFPQTVRNEVDFATGKVKTVMVKWDEFEAKLHKND